MVKLEGRSVCGLRDVVRSVCGFRDASRSVWRFRDVVRSACRLRDASRCVYVIFRGSKVTVGSAWVGSLMLHQIIRR